MKLKRKHIQIASILIFIILSSSLIAVLQIEREIIDESIHYGQIMRFIGKDYSLAPNLPLIPGYHMIISIVAYAVDVSAIPSIRAISFFFSILSIACFFFLSGVINEKSAHIKTFQYCLFPLVYPFFFLIYTDVMSLLLVLLSIAFALKRKHNLSGIIGILAVSVRQNNIVWLFFASLLVYANRHGLQVRLRFLKEWAITARIFIIGFILALAFIFLNGGYSMKVVESHPANTLNSENLFLALFLFFFIFLPFNISNIPRIINFMRRDRVFVFFTAITFLFYLASFSVDHPWNLKLRDYFLRNMLLQRIMSSLVLKVIAYVPIAYSMFSLAVTKLHKKEFYMIYPLSALYLSASWLVEPRYYIIPFILFQLFREEKGRLAEYSSLLMYFTASMLILNGIVGGRFFI